MRRIAAMALGCALIASATAAQGQQPDYPARAVHVLAAAAPGGNPDVLARLLSQRLSEILGQPFVVENVPGAGGILAAKRVAGSVPDGYTVMINDFGRARDQHHDEPRRELHFGGFHTHYRARHRSNGLRRHPVSSGQYARRIHRARESEARNDVLRVRGSRLDFIISQWRSSPSEPASSFFTFPIAAVPRW